MSIGGSNLPLKKERTKGSRRTNSIQISFSKNLRLSPKRMPISNYTYRGLGDGGQLGSQMFGEYNNALCKCEVLKYPDVVQEEQAAESPTNVAISFFFPGYIYIDEVQ